MRETRTGSSAAVTADSVEEVEERAVLFAHELHKLATDNTRGDLLVDLTDRLHLHQLDPLILRDHCTCPPRQVPHFLRKRIIDWEGNATITIEPHLSGPVAGEVIVEIEELVVATDAIALILKVVALIVIARFKENQ